MSEPLKQENEKLWDDIYSWQKKYKQLQAEKAELVEALESTTNSIRHPSATEKGELAWTVETNDKILAKHKEGE